MRVLVSGAGIAGPTLAYWLSKASINVTVLEKSKAALAQGQNIDIEGNAITICKRMGVWDEIKRLNTTEKGTQLIDPRGRPFAPFPVKDGRALTPTSPNEILRGDLALTLYGASKDLPNVKYRFGVTINKVLENGEREVRVELSNGEVETYDLLVAADGQWSRIRKEVFPPELLTVVDKDMYAVYYTIPRQAGDDEWWNLYIALNSRVVTSRPDPHGTLRVCFTMMPTSDAQKAAWQQASRFDRKAQEELVRQEFHDAGWQSQRYLDAMSSSNDFYLQAFQQIRLSKWSQGRVVCIGDAAYAPTPLAGSGVPLAIMGAYILAGELSKLSEGGHPGRAFEAYESAFRGHVEDTQKLPSFVPGVAHPKTEFQRWLLQRFVAVLSWIANIPWVAERFTSTDPEKNDNGFRLPTYSRLEEKGEVLN